jgi:hypothetical protein
MFSGDELYDEEVTSGPLFYGDPMERADWIRDESKYDVRCKSCRQVSVSFEGDFCNRCPDQTGYLAAKAMREAVNAR